MRSVFLLIGRESRLSLFSSSRTAAFSILKERDFSLDFGLLFRAGFFPPLANRHSLKGISRRKMEKGKIFLSFPCVCLFFREPFFTFFLFPSLRVLFLFWRDWIPFLFLRSGAGSGLRRGFFFFPPMTREIAFGGGGTPRFPPPPV